MTDRLAGSPVRILLVDDNPGDVELTILARKVRETLTLNRGTV